LFNEITLFLASNIFLMAHEWKKAEKQFYLPGTKPVLIKVPSFSFFSIRGQGNPNDKLFAEHIGVLYSLAYAVKMSPKKGLSPANYFDYTVYPLEGVWDITEEAKKISASSLDKSTLVYNLMIRQPAFVTGDFAADIIKLTKKKKPHPLLENVTFNVVEEGECVQMMHIGSYDDEPASFKKMEEFCHDNNFTRESKVHREIYLSDARKVSPEKLKTILRFKIILP
jgi:hypothetical protein